MAVVTLHLINNDVGPLTIKSRAGDSFRLEAFVFPKSTNVGGGTLALSLNCTDTTGVNSPTTVVGLSQAVPATGSWSFMGAYATVPAGYNTVDPVLTLTSVPVTDIVYVDDVLVREETVAYSSAGSAAAAQTTASAAIDAAVQALTGGSGTGNSAGAMKTNMGAIPSSCVAPTPNPSTSGVPAHGASATGITSTLDSSGSAQSLNTSGTGTCTKATADNFAGGWLLYAISITSTGATPSNFYTGISYGSQAMSSLTGPIIVWQSGSLYWCMEYFVLANPAAGAQTIQGQLGSTSGRILLGACYGIWAVVDTYSGVVSASYDVVTASTSGTSLTRALPTTASNLPICAFAAVNYLGSEAITAFNKTSRSNTSPGTMDSAGTALCVGETAGLAGTVTFTATSSGGVWAAVGINLHGAGSTSIGSGFRVSRTSTGTFNSPATTTPAVLPASSFNSTPDAASTTDYTWTQSTNTVTVANAGWYAVTLSLLLTGTYGSNYILGLELFRNGSNVRHGLRFNQGGYANIMHCAWHIYCNAGDTLQPGSYANFGSALAAFTGTADGLSTFFEVQPTNRSLL